ncbi:hypothetical protein CCHR01_17459 [Colletotrichum chrysophilum]|uniref:Uncharacterized protein n=1 Tax=Colletotrichum chrysophilum TaxID=1836956 RepID=A0AAD9A1X4_9PEZI|nr:hypothetical protein CCHR01_17459 [Colletotrichum chrysophilum]
MYVRQLPPSAFHENENWPRSLEFMILDENSPNYKSQGGHKTIISEGSALSDENFKTSRRDTTIAKRISVVILTNIGDIIILQGPEE